MPRVDRRIAESMAVAGAVVAEEVPEPLVRTLAVPCSAASAAATVPVTADTGAWTGVALTDDAAASTARIAELMAVAGAVVAEAAPEPLGRILVVPCSAASAAATVPVTADTGACTVWAVPEPVALAGPSGWSARR